jgi:epoxyqueuosine reductase
MLDSDEIKSIVLSLGADKCGIAGIDACPAQALDDETVNQKLCRELSCPQHPRGFDIYSCNLCRKVCPLGKHSSAFYNQT